MSTQRSHFSTVYGNTEWSAGVVERAAVPLPSVWKLVLVWEMWIEVLYSRPWPKIVLGMFSPVIIFFPFLSPPFLIWPVMWDVKTYSNLPFHSLPLTWSGPLNPAKGISCKCICGLFRAPRTCQVAANVILSCWGGGADSALPQNLLAGFEGPRTMFRIHVLWGLLEILEMKTLSRQRHQHYWKTNPVPSLSSLSSVS